MRQKCLPYRPNHISLPLEAAHSSSTIQNNSISSARSAALSQSNDRSVPFRNDQSSTSRQEDGAIIVIQSKDTPALLDLTACANYPSFQGQTSTCALNGKCTQQGKPVWCRQLFSFASKSSEICTDVLFCPDLSWCQGSSQGSPLFRRAKNAKNKPRTGAEVGRRDFPFFSVQSLYDVELQSSLRRHLARCTNGRRMNPHFVENSIVRLAFGSADSFHACQCSTILGAPPAGPTCVMHLPRDRQNISSTCTTGVVLGTPSCSGQALRLGPRFATMLSWQCHLMTICIRYMTFYLPADRE